MDTATGKKREDTVYPSTAPETPKPKEVQVYIVTDPKTNKIIDVVPDPFHVSKKNLQEVRWICIPEQNFSVDFDKGDGTPFYESHFDQDNPCSGLPGRRVEGLGNQKSYGYTIRTDYDTRDPQGVVDP